MGSIILPVCENCGYKAAKIYLGGGMSNHLTYCAVPALNTETNEIVTVDFFSDVIKEDLLKDKPTYKIYNGPNMHIINDGIDYHHWGDLKFKIHGNLCPKCKSYNLIFESCGCWD